MKNNNWFYKSDLTEKSSEVTLDGDEARHALKVRRIKRHELVSVFNGRGTIAICEIMETSEKPAMIFLKILEHHHETLRKPSIHLISSIPKGEKQILMLDMATQVGISEFTPLTCNRSINYPAIHAFKRWERKLIEACKQSRRLWIPELHELVCINEWINNIDLSDACIIYGDSSGKPINSIEIDQISDMEKIWIAVGPEGGFNQEEIQILDEKNASKVRIGDNNLRIETAAVVLSAAALQLALK
tara:strand:+ start:405 stop:1139 length:735 start_codon:yes stop_codon:yes gene_type:complete